MKRLLPASLAILFCVAHPTRGRCQSSAPREQRYDAAARPPSTWAIDTSAALRIGGGADSHTEFSHIVGAVRLSDGRVFIADEATSELRLFSANGAFIKNVGRRGRGPGEYEGISYLYRSADTVIVHDRVGRLQVFGPDGTLLRAHERPTFSGHSMSYWPGMLGDGSGIVQGVDPTVEMTGDRATQTGTLGIVAAGANDAKPLVSIPVFERVKRNGAPVGLFLGATAKVVVFADRVCAGYSLTWDVRCYLPSGTQVSRTIRAVQPGPVTDADKTEYKQAYVAAMKNTPPAQAREAAERLQFADTRSAFGRFVAGATGELWVGEFVVLESIIAGRRGTVAPSRPTRWTVLGRDGAWVAEVSLPARFSLLDAGRNYVAGIQADTDDVESLVVYRLRR